MEPENYQSTLIQNGIIFINGEIDSQISTDVVSKLKYLELSGYKKTVTIYINSPGGDVQAGFAIYDAIRLSPLTVSIIAIGEANSIAAVILSGGKKGYRYATENAKILIHQPIGGANGQATDILIASKNISKVRHRINLLLAQNTGKDLKRVARDTERDNIMTPEEALEYGIIDKILRP